MTDEPKPGPVFAEALDYHRAKLALPSKAWTDIWQREHARAFIVAGAATEELVTGFHEAIARAIEEGRTLADFRKDFDALVAAHGWSYNGSRGWRSAVIYNTNLSQAYSAGRWEQGQRLDGAVGRYRHNPSSHERAEHKAWHGITLPLGHSWFATHWPINAWGCHCQVDILSAAAARRAGWQVSDDPPEDPMVTHTVPTPDGPRTVTVPKGIDPGFDYNPGQAAFGTRLAEDVMDQWRAAGRDAWEMLTPGDWQSAGRPARVPADPTRMPVGPKAEDREALQKAVERAIGGKERVFEMPDGSRIMVDAAALAGHIDPARAPFLPLLSELLTDPYEIWMSFERHAGTGKVELRRRLVKIVQLDKDHSLTLVAQATQGRLQAWTFVPSKRPEQLKRSRVGKLLYGRE